MRAVIIGKFVVLMIAATALASPAYAQRIGSSPAAPAPVGATVQTIVECGDGYESHELYDARITLLEAVRGEQAWELIKAAEATAEAPKDGWDYLLAHVKFDYAARGRPGDCAHNLKEQEFVSTAPDGQPYAATSVPPPKPRLNGTMHSGDSLEGWVVFSVPRADGLVLMSFGTKEGGGFVHGGNTWFKLY